ncbi:MAG: protein translocase subunit SecF, partial [Clostridiales Family XIII bacterium]|nr:protein translocase subunit SecF [Clostridiales Family XIII bacterium]
MAKKIVSLAITILIILLWVVTLKGIGPVGPLKDDIKLGLDISGGVYVVMEAQTQDVPNDELEQIMNQTQSVIERRVNEMGLSETVVTIEGENRIRAEMPGADNAEQAIESIGRTAQLKFLLADGTEALNGSDISNSGVDRNQERAGYVVTLDFTSEGAEKFYDATSKASGGVISSDQLMKGPDGNVAVDEMGFPIQPNDIVIMLDDEIISAPEATKPIEGREAVITGTFTLDEAKELSMLIRGGALPVELKEVESAEIGATLGLGALQSSVKGGVIGIVLIMLLMLGLYRLLGLGANLALLLYIPALLWVLVLLGGVLTLPGIAGIILSIGMAVDANVIIFARIKEEVGNGKSIRVSMSTGFRRALGTIVDSQLTTLIASLVLYLFGTGPVKGFALTLMIGIIIGVITAVIVTHVYIGAFSETRFLATPFLLGIKEGNADQHTRLKRQFNFIKHRKIYYICTAVILVVGIGVGLIRGYNFGIDFTGGTMLQIDMQRVVSVEDVRDTLRENDIADADIVHFGDENHGVIIKTTKSLDKDERAALLDDFFEKYDLNEDSVQAFEQFGPSIGELLKKNAVISVLIAALGMLVYIVFRFRWRFGVAAVIGVFHDVFIMIAFYGLFQMTVNNPFIAAILTVVGYSINDTIVIFDRIRENLGLMSKRPLDELVDTSINQTLVRSLMTAGTTVLAILPLVVFGGETIRQFVIPLMIGILCGAASSIFISSPLFYELNRITGKGGRSGKY